MNYADFNTEKEAEIFAATERANGNNAYVAKFNSSWYQVRSWYVRKITMETKTP